jgi:REP element-mobilizing transposase RayT
MEFRPPIAFHFTVTTYGTRLHGDERGTVFRGRGGHPTHLVEPDPQLRQSFEDLMKHPIVLLDAQARGVVEDAIVEHCKFRKWHLYALNVRTNHFHAVVDAAESSSKMMNSIKARATRLLREKLVFSADAPVWTERGSKRRLYTQKALDEAIYYVQMSQGPDLPRD